jgi:hypothetical protein
MSLGIIAAGIGVVGLASAGLFNMISANGKVQQAIQTQAILDQAAYSMVTESAESGGLMTLNSATGYVAGANLTALPASSTSPKKDGFGKSLVYCTPSAFPATGAPTGIVFALLSPGPNGVIDTTCATALTGAKTGDDGLRYKTVNDIRKGVGGTVYYGDPVATAADLPSSMRDGEVRFVKDVGQFFQFSMKNNGWASAMSSASSLMSGFNTGSLSLKVSGDTCTTIGQLSKDSSSRVMVCGTDSTIPFADCTAIGVGQITYVPSGGQYICAN